MITFRAPQTFITVILSGVVLTALNLALFFWLLPSISSQQQTEGAREFAQDSQEVVFICDDEQNCTVETKDDLSQICRSRTSSFPFAFACKSSEDLQFISMIADPANVVPTPFTKKTKKVETIYDEKYEFRGFDLEISQEGKLYALAPHRGQLLAMDVETKNIESYDLPLSLREQESIQKLSDAADSNGGIGNMGLALDKGFKMNGLFYVYSAYSLTDNPANDDPSLHPGKLRLQAKVTKYRLSDGEVEEVQMLLDNIPGSVWHTGGRLEIGPDDKLYVTTGDGQEHTQASSLDYLGGKILRLNLDGSIPDDNPFGQSLVYSKGFRNPQGLAWNDQNQLYASEHGVNHFDEINLISAGGDYGWSNRQCDEGYSNDPNTSSNAAAFQDPVFCTKTWTLAPSGITFINDLDHPWYNWLFVAGLRGGHVHAIQFDSQGNRVDDEIFFISQLDADDDELNLRIRDVEVYNDDLYILSDAGEVFRVTPDSLP